MPREAYETAEVLALSVKLVLSHRVGVCSARRCASRVPLEMQAADGAELWSDDSSGCRCDGEE